MPTYPRQPPRLGARPIPSQHPSTSFKPRADTRGSTIAIALVWILVSLLVLRWDWIAQQEGTLVIGQGYGTNPMMRIMKLVILGWATILVFQRMAVARAMLRYVNVMFIAFVVMVPMSMLWSISPGDTAARFVSLISVVQVCFAFSLVSWNPRRFQQVVRPLITTILFFSIVVGLFQPKWIIEIGEGTLKDAWHGLLSSKNSFGQAAGFGVILWIHAWMYEKQRWIKIILPLILAFTCLLLTRSSTSLLATLFAVLFMSLLIGLPPNLRRYMPMIVVAFSVLVLVYGLAVLNLIPGLDLLFKPIALLTGKDTTFSARSEIWKIIEENIALHPLLGSGYSAYWIGPVFNSPSYAFLSRMFFYPYEAHNGYLEITNDLGYVGLFILIGYIWIYVKQSVSLLHTERNQAVLLLSLFFQQALINLSESTWLNVSAPYGFILLTMATFTAARLQLEHGRRSPAPRMR